jgi:O-antigen ligase
VSLQDEQAADRKELWQGAWNQIAAAPIFGMGRGNYGGQVHNTALEILCETGMLGLVSYAILAYWSVAGLILERWSYPSHKVATGARILLIALMTVGVSGMTISIENYRGLWVLFGVGELYRRLYRDTTGEWMAPDMAPIRLTPDTRARIVS